MSSIAIYMEGGGDGRDTKAALRLGMDSFLTGIKQAAREKSLRWKLVCCGSRYEAFRSFRSSFSNGEHAITILLVDAEGLVNRPVRDHLRWRDGWDVAFASDDMVHLMIQTMETWIIADPDALTEYYGSKFKRNALPGALELEKVAKDDVGDAFNKATRPTRKGAYHKIRHASDLLKRINPREVKQRCPGCARLFRTMHSKIDEI